MRRHGHGRAYRPFQHHSAPLHQTEGEELTVTLDYTGIYQTPSLSKSRGTVFMEKIWHFFFFSYLGTGPCQNIRVQAELQIHRPMILPSQHWHTLHFSSSRLHSSSVNPLAIIPSASPLIAIALPSQSLTSRPQPCLLLRSTNEPTHPQSLQSLIANSVGQSVCVPYLHYAPISKTESPHCLGHLTKLKST